MTLALYIFLAIAIFLIICGVLAQVEIEQWNEDRRRRRLQMRHIAYEEIERIDFTIPYE